MEIVNIVKESNSLTLTTIDVMNGFNNNNGPNSSSSSSLSNTTTSELTDESTNRSNLNCDHLTATLDSCLSNDFFSLHRIASSHSLFDSFSTTDFADLNDGDFDCLTGGNELNDGLRHDVSVGTGDLCLNKDLKRKFILILTLCFSY